MCLQGHILKFLLSYYRQRKKCIFKVILICFCFQVGSSPTESGSKHQDFAARAELNCQKAQSPKFRRHPEKLRSSSVDMADENDNIPFKGDKGRSSKHGLYDLNLSSPESPPTQKTRLSRTFSFSGTYPLDETCTDSTDGINTDTSVDDTCLSASVRMNSPRKSVYDNVPILNSKITCSDRSINNSDQDLQTSNTAFRPIPEITHRAPSNVESDLSSEEDLSSQEDPDEDGMDHLNVPGEVFEPSFPDKVMGSVDSGVPSSPVLRTPGYVFIILISYELL